MSFQELFNLITKIHKLAAIRKVWDGWVERLPLMYNPGPELTEPGSF